MIHECTIKISNKKYDAIRSLIAIRLREWEYKSNDEYESAMKLMKDLGGNKWDDQYYGARFVFDDGTEFCLDICSDDASYWTAWQWHDKCHRYSDKQDDFADMDNDWYQFEPLNIFDVEMEDGHTERYECWFDIDYKED